MREEDEMKRFLSEESIALHKDYVRLKRLKYSIIESSVPSLVGAEIKDIYRMKIDARDKRDALVLLADIRLHEISFSSFAEAPYQHSRAVCQAYGNEPDFLNLLYKRALNLPYGFVLVYRIGDRIEVRECTDYASALRTSDPALAIDVCEHVYFMDYGFDKEKYLLASLPYLNLATLSASGD